MKKHYESKKGFGKKAEAAARNAILEKLIQDCGAQAFRFALKLSGNVEAAEELVQEASYRVLRAWDRYDRSRPFNLWFFSILRNAFLDSIKRAKRWKWIALDVPIDGTDGARYGDILSDEGGDVAETLAKADDQTTAREAVERLRADYRAVIEMWEMNGMGYEEIAGSLGIPLGTVRSRLFRARRALRKHSELATTP